MFCDFGKSGGTGEDISQELNGLAIVGEGYGKIPEMVSWKKEEVKAAEMERDVPSSLRSC